MAQQHLGMPNADGQPAEATQEVGPGDLGDPGAVHAVVEQIRAADAINESNTVRAMQRLFSLCRSKTPGHIANQAAAADADAVSSLLRLVGTGSIRQRTWAFNTLGRLCFDHAENAAKVCSSSAMEVAVENMLGLENTSLPAGEGSESADNMDYVALPDGPELALIRNVRAI